MRLQSFSTIAAAITLMILCGVFVSVRFVQDGKRTSPIHPAPNSTSAAPLGKEPGEPLVIVTQSNKAIINWESWTPDDEPFEIKAPSEDSVVIFRFKQPPKDLGTIKVTSNAAVYAETEDGLVPLTERARSNPIPLTPSRTLAELFSFEGPAPVLRDH